MTEGLSMDIKYFEYVIEIVECGSINKAAQNLQMLQPNLSVCIKNLEQELGFPSSAGSTAVYASPMKVNCFLNPPGRLPRTGNHPQHSVHVQPQGQPFHFLHLFI